MIRVVVGVIMLVLVGECSAQELTLEVTHRARSVQPGEVVVIEVRPSEPPVIVRATAFGAAVPLYPDDSDGVWRGLIGIDLEARPDDYSVAIRATTGGGATVRATYPLTVAAKEFPTRHLTVAPNFVNPPPDVLDRIQREAARQSEIFTSSSTDRQWAGGFIRPVPGESSSSFGRRSVYNGEARSPHSGTDFRSGEGTPIKAPNAGTVVLAGELYFSGNVVILDHGWGLYSYLAHLSAIDVAEGDVVEPGQVVGKVGATGRVTGPHLHWTVRLNNARVDPLALMTLFPVDADQP